MKRGILAVTLALLAPVAAAETPLLASQVPGLVITAMSELPAAPAAVSDMEYCGHFFIEPQTAGGKAVQAKGWHVTAEQPLGAYTAVSFAGKAEPATSGACILTEGNVALWSGEQVVALVYGLRPDDAMIGRIDPFGKDGLRILSGDLVPGTVADIRVIGQSGIAVTPPAAVEPVCDGRAEVPFIEGMPINMARTLLMERGWQPVPNPQPGIGMVQILAEAGVPEVEDCSGTGFAFCAYSYSGPAGSLSVISAGEGDDAGLPSVIGYRVECRAE